jgi:mannose-6-phosphate isomerase-like protein (cupin superfamily)
LPEKTENCCTKTKVRKIIQNAEFKKTEVDLFEMQPGGYSPLHNHKTQHTLLVLKGEGAVYDGEKITPINVDDVVVITTNELHQLKNIGKKPLSFLCVTYSGK